MRAGEFPNGARVLRAKIDMSSGNINLRDPVLYRILHAEHPRTGGTWFIYPTYDFAHGQSDAIEGVTHSICTLEFEDHRPLYDWLIESLPVPSRPRQYEFARLNLGYTVLTKRFLNELVPQGRVAGSGAPRNPHLLGLRPRAPDDPATRGGNAPAGRKVQATLHWVTVADSLPAEIRLYNQLFSRPDPGAGGDLMADLNPDSLERLSDARVEPALADATNG